MNNSNPTVYRHLLNWMPPQINKTFIPIAIIMILCVFFLSFT